MDRSITRHWYAARSCHSDAIIVLAVGPSNRFSRLIWVRRGAERGNLVEIALQCQMGTLAANVGYGEHISSCNLALEVQMPLLHIGPHRLVRNRSHIEREIERDITSVRTLPDVLVSQDIELLGRQDNRRGSFQRLRIALAAVRMLEKYSVPCANGHLSFSCGVIGKAQARSEIRKMSL